MVNKSRPGGQFNRLNSFDRLFAGGNVEGFAVRRKNESAAKEIGFPNSGEIRYNTTREYPERGTWRGHG